MSSIKTSLSGLPIQPLTDKRIVEKVIYEEIIG